MNSKFINNLKKIRKNNNLSQEQLAEIYKMYINYIEQNQELE